MGCCHVTYQFPTCWSPNFVSSHKFEKQAYLQPSGLVDRWCKPTATVYLLYNSSYKAKWSCARRLNQFANDIVWQHSGRWIAYWHQRAVGAGVTIATRSISLTTYPVLQCCSVFFCGDRLWNGLPYAIRPLSVLSVCNVGVLWPNGWMDQDET